jgi:hypothetical protein
MVDLGSGRALACAFAVVAAAISPAQASPSHYKHDPVTTLTSKIEGYMQSSKCLSEKVATAAIATATKGASASILKALQQVSTSARCPSEKAAVASALKAAMLVQTAYSHSSGGGYGSPGGSGGPCYKDPRSGGHGW